QRDPRFPPRPCRQVRHVCRGRLRRLRALLLRRSVGCRNFPRPLRAADRALQARRVTCLVATTATSAPSAARGSRRLVMTLPLTPAGWTRSPMPPSLWPPVSAWPSPTQWRASWLCCRKPRGEGSLHRLLERCQKSFASINEIAVGPHHAKFGRPHPH